MTLNRAFEIRRAEQPGRWDLYQGDRLVEAQIKGWDAALTRIAEQGLATVEELNTRPAKSQTDSPGAQSAVEAKPKHPEIDAKGQPSPRPTTRKPRQKATASA